MIIGVGNSGSKIGVFKAIPHDNGFTFRLSKKIKIDPELARQYDGKYVLTFDGSVIANRDGRTIECYSNKENPIIDKSHPSDENACIINAKIDSIAIQSPRGSILAHWSSP